MTEAAWIAVDWGSTNVRAWLMEADTPVAEATSATHGANAMNGTGYEDALLALINPWLDRAADVMMCGVVGSREGWMEAPYSAVPCKPSGNVAVPVPTKDPRVNAYVLPGLSQTNPRAAIMRGEETQIAGYLAKRPTFDGVICLPGTHSKWVHISAEEVVSFASFMTGELFSVLSQKSILAQSVLEGAWDEGAFLEAVDTTLSRPESLAALLLTLRADDIVLGADKSVAYARLSGWILGAEIAATKPYWLGQDLVLIGASNLCRAYASALAAQGILATVEEAGPLTRTGLYAARQTLRKEAL